LSSDKYPVEGDRALKTIRKGRKVAGAKHARAGGYARGAKARQRIVLAALAVFGAEGFEGASTRVIAERAGVVLPALQYYFGGKQSLYQECARHIAAEISAILDPALVKIAPLIAATADTSPQQAKAALYDLLDNVVDMLVGSRRPEAWVMFIIREQANPTAAFDLIYEQALGRVSRACTALVSKALGKSADDPEVRVRGFAVLGQLIAFRAARAAALRSLGWRNFNGERLKIMKRALRAHTEAALR
jgi:AcrR family transcriptional regulator